MVNQMQEMPEMILEDPDENSAMISSYVPNPQGTYHQSHYYSTAGPSSHPQRMPHAGYQNVSQPQYYQSRSHHHHHHLSGITQPTMAYDDFQHHPQPLQDQRRIQQNPRGHYPQHRMPQRVYIHSDPSDFRYSHHGQYPQVYQEEIVQTSHDPSLPSYSQQQDSSVYYEQRIPYPIASIQMSRQPINNVVESNIESTNSQGNTFDESVIEESQLQYIVPQAEMFEASASGEDPYLPSVGSTCTIETSSPSPAAQQQMDIYDFSVGDDEMESQMPTSVPSSFAPGISLTTPHLVRQTGPSKDKSLIQQQQFKQVKRKQISSTIPAFEEEDDEEESGSNRLTSPISKMAKSATNSEKVKSPTLKGQQMNINALHIVPVVKRTRKQVFPSNSKETKSSLVPTSSSKILTTKEKEKTGKSLPSVKQKKEESSRTLQVWGRLRCLQSDNLHNDDQSLYNSNNNKQSTSISTQQQMQSVGGSLIARQQAGISPQSITKTRPKVARVKMSKPRNTGTSYDDVDLDDGFCGVAGEARELHSRAILAMLPITCLEDGNDIVMAASKSLKDKKKAPISTTSTTSTMAAKITTKLSHQSSSSSSSTLSTTSTSSSMGTKKTDSLQKVKLSSSTVDSMASAVGGAKSKTTGDSAGRRTTSVAQKEDTNTSLIGSILAASAMPPKIQKRTNTIMLSDSFMDALNEQTVKKPKIVRKKVAPTVVTTAASSTTTTTILDGPLYRDTPVTSLASSFSASSSFSSSTIVRPTLNIHRELSDPLDNNPDYLGNKARRRICFADEKGAELTTIRYFELEEGERMNVTKMTSEEMKHMEMHNERIQHEKSGHFKSVTNLPMPQGFGFRQQINCTTLRPWKLIPLEGITELIERGVNSESKLIELRRQNTVMEAFCDPFTPLPMSDIDEVDNQRPDGAMPPKPIPLEPILSPSEEDFMAGGTAITSDGAANDASHITSFTTASSVMPSASSIITQLPLPFSSSSSSSAAWSSSSHQQEQMNQTNFRLSSKLLPPNVAALMSGLSPNVSSLLLDEPHKSLPQNETLSFSSPIQAPSTKTKAPEVEKIVAKAKKEDKEDIDSPQSPVGFAETTNDENIDDILEAMDTTKSPEGPDSPESFVKSPMDEVDNEVIMIDDVDRREKNVEKNNVEDEDKEDTDIRCIPAERMPDDDADEEDVSQMDVDCRMFSGTAVAAATAPSSPTITDMSEFMSKLRSTGIIGGVNWAAGILDKVGGVDEGEVCWM